MERGTPEEPDREGREGGGGADSRGSGGERMSWTMK